jgi:hypothetical protein
MNSSTSSAAAPSSNYAADEIESIFRKEMDRHPDADEDEMMLKAEATYKRRAQMMIDLEASKIRATNAALGQGLTALPSHTPQQSSIGMSWQHARCAMINLTHPFSLSLSLSLSLCLSLSLSVANTRHRDVHAFAYAIDHFHFRQRRFEQHDHQSDPACDSRATINVDLHIHLCANDHRSLRV